MISTQNANETGSAIDFSCVQVHERRIRYFVATNFT